MTTHRWQFYRAGGLDQVVFRSGQDIVNLRALDQKLWVALACPTEMLSIDERTLTLLDADKDGRIRPPELIATAEWLRDVYRNPDELMTSRDFVPLSAINDKTDAGKAILASARRVLELVGKPGAAQVSLADATDHAKLAADPARNGDGIVPPEGCSDPAEQRSIADIIATRGSKKDRSGKDGIEQAHVDEFFADAAAYLAWLDKMPAVVSPLLAGEAMVAALSAVQAVRGKVDDYFARCGLAAYDPRSQTVLTGTDADFTAVAAKELGEFPAELIKLPLSRIEADRPLSLVRGVNPAWADKLSALWDQAVKPLLGPDKTALSPADWSALQGKLAAYAAWQADKPATKVDSLGPDRLRELIASGMQARLSALIAADAAVAPEFAKMEELEKLIRCQRDFLKLLNNFVSFADFYGQREPTFLAGTLYLDGRACHLCLAVRDAGKHAALAGFSKAYLAYCDLARAGSPKQAIVAAFTNGDIDNLMVGRNGVFYDRKGNDWDATITKIVENPISIRQAFWAPYKSAIRLLEEQVAKRAAAAESESKKQVETAAAATAQADKTKIGEAKPEKKGVDVGTVAAIGVAVGGIATFLTGIFATFFGLGYWMPLGLLALMLAISGPAMFVAWLKLRQRNMGPILDANGWAVNGMVKITVPFGGTLTDLPSIPPDAERSLKDPFAEKRSPWGLYLLLLFLLGVGLAWYVGRLDPLLPASVKSTTVLGELSPASRPPMGEPEKK